jgi:hypothetical protein
VARDQKTKTQNKDRPRDLREAPRVLIMKLPKEVQGAFRSGHVSFHADPEIKNPYKKEGTRVAWQFGWEKAREEKEAFESKSNKPDRKTRSVISPAVYAKHRERLGLSQVKAGVMFGVTDRTGQSWATNGAPLAVVMVMSLYETAEEVAELAAKVSASK